jgi:hypothetical protein
MRKLYEGREPKYQALAHLIVNVDDGVPHEIAEKILAAAA